MWSARFSGDITLALASEGSWVNLRLAIDGWARVWLDDELVIDSWHDTTGFTYTAAVFSASEMTADVRRLRIDYRPNADRAKLVLNRVSGSPTEVDALVPGTDLAPRYDLQTGSSKAGVVTTTSYLDPALSFPVATTVDPTGLALVSATGYESDAAGHYTRRVSRTMPSGAATTYAYHGADGAPASLANPCVPGSPAVHQGAARWRSTGPDPDGAGPAAARVDEAVYDAAGRVVASRIGTGGWNCTSFDARGRPAAATIAAFGAEPARTVSYNYAVGANPLVSAVSDPAGTITTTVDLLGRSVAHKDVWAKTSTSTYDQAGRLTATTGPAGARSFDYNAARGQ